MLEWIKRFSLRKKLVGALVAVGILPVLIFGFLTWNLGSNAINRNIANELDTITETKKGRIELWFSTIKTQIQSQAEKTAIVGALYAFSDAFSRIAQGNPENAVTELQRLYIRDNPHPIGQKDRLIQASDKSYYSELHAQYHPWLNEFQRSLGYYDIFLVDLSGNIVYTVFKEVDYATNLETGPFKDTGLAEAYRKVKETGDVFLSDYAPYAPSNGDAASFIGAPIEDAGTMVGVLLYQMPLTHINAILHERTTFGSEGESYLVGPDGLLRSDSQLKPEEFTLSQSFKKGIKPPVPVEKLNEALAGSTSNYRGVGITFSDVLVEYAPVNVLNQRWVLVVERSAESAYSDLNMLLLITLGATGISIVLLGGFALVTAKAIGDPLKGVLEVLKRASTHFLSISDQLSESSQQMADGASQQASALEQTSASLTEISATAKTNADASQQASVISAEMLESTRRGQIELEDIRTAIENMRDAANKSSAIIKSIDEIAFQTQLLSLNAAVEAARAGNIGLGFAVVADEVRNLATKSTTAARETEELISRSKDAAQESFAKLNHYAKALSNISENSDRITLLVSEIKSGTMEQADGTEQIAKGVHQSEKIVQSNAASAEELAGSAYEMISEARIVEENINRLDQLVNGK